MATKRTRYSKVPTSDHNNDELRPGSGSSASPASQRKELVESISNKLHAAIWVGGSIFVLYYTDFFRLAWADERVNRIALDISLICDGAFMAIGFYLVVWLGMVKGNTYEWNVVAPNMVPTAAGFSALATITFMIAFWPVWGLLTLPITALFVMGILFSAHFIPVLP